MLEGIVAKSVGVKGDVFRPANESDMVMRDNHLFIILPGHFCTLGLLNSKIFT